MNNRIQVKNRRKMYLDRHPEYFKSPELELAGRFLPRLSHSYFPQISHQRTNTSPSDPLLYDRLVRRFQTAEEREKEGRARGYTGVLEADLVRSEAKIEALQRQDPNNAVVYKRAPDGHILAVEQDEEASDRLEAWERWSDLMTQRFLRGDDDQFDYDAVDESEEFDDRVEEERRRLEQYLDSQSPEFVGEESPRGETGVQDF
jgi:hypothetical protein